MSMLQTGFRAEVDADRIGRSQLIPAVGFGETSYFMFKRLMDLRRPSPTFQNLIESSKLTTKSLNEQLYDALASFKIKTAAVAMHLDRDWRAKLFRQLDNLLDVENWESDDLPPQLASFSTFLRLLILLRPDKRPGLGAAHDGKMIATWTSGTDKLTVECLPNDSARWNLSVTIDGEIERAAAITPLRRLGEVLKPYQPERWFDDGRGRME
jgi:hypothetical protein